MSTINLSIKKINYTTNQGADSKQQNLPFSKNVKTAFERLNQCLKKNLLTYPCAKV